MKGLQFHHHIINAILIKCEDHKGNRLRIGKDLWEIFLK